MNVNWKKMVVAWKNDGIHLKIAISINFNWRMEHLNVWMVYNEFKMLGLNPDSVHVHSQRFNIVELDVPMFRSGSCSWCVGWLNSKFRFSYRMLLAMAYLFYDTLRYGIMDSLSSFDGNAIIMQVLFMYTAKSKANLEIIMFIKCALLVLLFT